MEKSLDIFINKLIDYAGLFPPARLDMADALRSFNAHRKSRYKNMVSAFICPALRLAEFESWLENKMEMPFLLSLITRGGDSREGFLVNLKSDLKNLSALQEKWPGIENNMIEAKYPADLLEKFDKKESLSFLKDVAGLLKNEVSEKNIYFEFGFFEGWDKTLPEVFKLFKKYSGGNNHVSANNLFRYKVRCGGVEPAAFPSSANIAQAIFLCNKYNIPFKATAGLHHPVRHYNTDLGCKMHGFFNVFFAAILSNSHNLEVEMIQKIIKDEDENLFGFSDDSIFWQDLEANLSEVQNCRENFAVSYGSCSVDEPIEDLQKLKLF